MKAYCGDCIYYKGTEKVPNPKSMAWFDGTRPDCVIRKYNEKKGYYCVSFVPKKVKPSSPKRCVWVKRPTITLNSPVYKVVKHPVGFYIFRDKYSWLRALREKLLMRKAV